jgi:ATP-dependent helicase HepA
MEFVLGQRWVSQTESELGLGIVVAMEGRHITVRFPVAEEDRVYAQNNSPLARVIYQVGETLNDQNQNVYTVSGVEDIDGLKCYVALDANGDETLLSETQISGLIQLSSPRQRLFSGQFGKSREYELRIASLYHQYDIERSEARGLLGVRTNLLPHQLYIAHEVASRFAPRVLLADEVGLGKTIEAGMILHHQLQTGLASRALIVVPDALLHQWLIEMLRKFGLRFALFDLARYSALLDSEEANPFESEQLVLCGLSMLVGDVAIAEQAAAANWDLLIVDEAHHLHWAPETPSAEYTAIEMLARECAGLLLLTATPEQLGPESHFARLRLLDPSRFSDLKSFTDEQAKYVELNQVVHQLTDDAPLSVEQQAIISNFTDIDHGPDVSNADLVAQLLDRHGTGRVLFRNTRAAIAGFPQREVHGYPLICTSELMADARHKGLYPETSLREEVGSWLAEDPRVAWLEEFFKARRSDKVLLICASAETAVDLERHLHLDVGIRSAAFYEDLSIVERDRAAAYFADEEAGAQTLICSEIGSEGRNFQFAHHLVLFDLPTNPDLLEQRIGRLDRIGQTSDIQIHVPYIAGTAQDVMFRWYNEGLDAFCHSFSAGAAVQAEFAAELEHVMSPEHAADPALVDALVAKTSSFTEKVRLDLQQGRDQLLELNSCNSDVAGKIIEAIEKTEAESDLQDYILLACDTFGVEPEPHSEHSLILKPTEHMLTHSFPYIGDDGLTVTFDREKALVREDMEFLSWESPVVSAVIEMVLGTELGNTNISTIELKAIPAGTLLVECFYAMRCSAPKKYQIGRFLPATPIRLLMDSVGRDLTGVIKHQQLNGLCQKIRKSTRPAIIKEIRETLSEILDKAEALAVQASKPLKVEAEERVHAIVGSELERLKLLRLVNPSIRSQEIDFFVSQQEHALAYIDQATLEPQAARVIITT